MGTDRIDNKGITKVTGTNPGFLSKYAGKQDDSLESMKSLVMLPRLKIIQGQTDADLKKKFGEGSVIVRPGDALVWQEGDAPFLLVPLFFHREWMKWADNKDKDQLIVEGPVYDETHPIALKSKTADTRTEVYPGDAGKPDRERKYYSYVEHLCWTCVIYGDHPLAGTEVVLGMERGEFYNGRQLINSISMRRHTIRTPNPNNPEELVEERVKVPLWAQVWAFQPTIRKGDLGNWYGLDFQAADNPVIDEKDAELFQSRYAELSRLFKEGKMRVVHSNEGNNQGVESTDVDGDVG